MEEQARILIVEDDPSWQEIYQEKLASVQDIAFDVSVADSVAGAVDAIHRRFYHAAIVDVRLSEKDPKNLEGLEVLERIWELDEGTEAIVVTGYAADMLAQFRKFRMFGMEDKSVLTPQEMLQQSRSAAFVKNYYSKEEGADAIVGKVKQIVATVLMESKKRKWMDSPFGLVRGFSAAEIQRDLRAGQMSELRPFLGDLCRPFHPWLKSMAPTERLAKQDVTMGFELKLWSRALGSALTVRFGRKDGQDVLLGDGNLAEPLGEMVAKKEQSHFVGVAYKLPGYAFEGHFEMPRLKKTSRSVFVTH